MNELASRAGKGMLWVFMTNALVRFFNFLVSVTLARILVPEDYGIVSLALVFTNAFAVFKDMRLSQALIYRKDNVHRAANVVFTLYMGWFNNFPEFSTKRVYPCQWFRFNWHSMWLSCLPLPSDP
jgi:O-antigen/teichoic acid export membrane protein